MRPVLYRIYRRIDNNAGLGGIAILFCVLAIASFAWLQSQSQEVALYRDNSQVAERFVSTVKADYPSNRVTTLYALRHMSSAYTKTGENDPSKLKQLERLEDWLLRSHTAGEEMLFLTEVRDHGNIAMERPWLLEADMFFLFALSGAFLGVFLHLSMSEWVKRNPQLVLGN